MGVDMAARYTASARSRQPGNAEQRADDRAGGDVQLHARARLSGVDGGVRAGL